MTQLNCDILVVAGGAAGGDVDHGGGGGAGGVILDESASIDLSNFPLSITIGAGGVNGVNNNCGYNTTVGSLYTAIGGGGGGEEGSLGQAGKNGGSGGGFV